MDEEISHVIRRGKEHETLLWLDHFGYAGAFVPTTPTLPFMPTLGVDTILFFAKPGGVALLAIRGNTLVWDEHRGVVGVVVEPPVFPPMPTKAELDARIEEGLLQAEEGRTRDLGSFKEFLVQDD